MPRACILPVPTESASGCSSLVEHGMSVTNPNGHVKIHRQIENSQVWRNAELLKVWLWCLLRASWSERWVDAKTGKGTTEVHLVPGEFIFGRFEAAAALQMKPSSVRNRMDKLTKMGNLALKVDTHWSIVTVCNWANYQAVPEVIGQAPGQATDNQRTGNGQAGDTNKNGKKEKKVEEGKERTATQTTLPDVPFELDTEQFRETWTIFIQHRAEIKHKLTPTAAGRLLAKMIAWGPERAVAAIEHSVANGWQGIFEQTKPGQRQPADAPSALDRYLDGPREGAAV